MNTFTKEHTQEHAHVRMGQGNHQRGAREAGSGGVAPHAQPSMPGAASARLPPALLPSGAKVPVSGMGRRVHTYKGWN